MHQNVMLNTKQHDVLAIVEAKKVIDDCVKLLVMGYNLDEIYDIVMQTGDGDIRKVPDPKKSRGDEVDARVMRELAEHIHTHLPHKYGFCLQVFEQSKRSETANYVGNVSREGAIEVMRQVADKLEQNRENPTQ